MGLVHDERGVVRCEWGASHADYRDYHDDEWGRPVVDDTRLFEKLSLEGFQAGLSWITILRKRENFRRAFANFDIPTVAAFGPDDVERLMGDAGIVRHRGKIEAVIGNAARVIDIQATEGSFAAFLWAFEPRRPAPTPREMKDVPARTDESERMSQALIRSGFRFVGPTTMYALMQAMGMVNDHLEGCVARDRVTAERDALHRPAPIPAA
jgi:DNA-3-methyladenine glycosylase I